MTALPDLSTDPRAKRVVKRPLPVSVRFAKTDGVCQTLEGAVGYHAGDAILTGVAGEQWPVARSIFDERYGPADGTTPGNDGNYIKKPLVVFALRLDVPIEVSMPAGGALHGALGDWLVQYGQADYGIIKDDIFCATYEFL